MSDVIQVKVIPNAKKNEILEHNQGLKVRITAPPVEGKANKLLVKLLADYFSCRKSEIKIIKGKKTKTKIIQVVKE